MQLPVKSFSGYLRDMSAAVQAATAHVLDLSSGSVLRAILEASAATALWLQMLVTNVFEASRATTAKGDDLDSWMADFSLTRLPACAAVGLVTFSRISGDTTALIPVGTRVRTTDAAASFLVSADVNHALWSSEQNGYLLSSSLLSADLPIEAELPGSAGNVRSGQITLIVSSIVGIDSVTNSNPTTGGKDAESDASFRDRFIKYVNSRSRATALAVEFAILSVRQGIHFRLHENVDASDAYRPGHFLITIDDGTGAPASELLTDIRIAVDAIRPLGITFSVHPPTVEVANVNLSVTLAAISPSAANRIRAEITDAIQQYIDSLEIGTALSPTRIAQVAYSVRSSVENVSNVKINNQSFDWIPGDRTVIKAGMVAVS